MVSSVGTADALSQLLSQWSIGSTSSTSSSFSTSSTSDSTSSSASITSIASMSESDLTTAFQQLASTLQAALLQAQSDSSQSGAFSSASGSDGTSARGGPPPNASQLFSQLDTNSDGTVTESEFVDGRPQGMSADQATSMWGQIDSSGASSLTESQFASGLQSLGQSGPPPGGGMDSTSSTSSSSVTQVAQNVLQDIQDALTSYQAASASLEKAMMAGSDLSTSA